MTCHALEIVCLDINRTFSSIAIESLTFCASQNQNRRRMEAIVISSLKLHYLQLLIIIAFLSTTIFTGNAQGSVFNSNIRPGFATSSGENKVQLNKSIKLSLSAEGGTGIATYSTMTPDICSVSAEGVVTGLHGGTCSILASTAGSDNYPVTTPSVIVLEVLPNDISGEKSMEAAKSLPELNVLRRNSEFIFTLNLGPSYKNKVAQIQVGIRNSLGRLNFQTISSTLLDSNGSSRLVEQATYAKNLYIRTVVNKKVIVTRKIR